MKIPRKEVEKQKKKEKRERYKEAAKGWRTGQYPTLSSCAKSFGVELKPLYQGIIKTGGVFPGRGKYSKVLKREEEERLINHVQYVASIGYGLSWLGLRLLIQEVLLSIKEASPSRITGLENVAQLPSISWVRRLAEHHDLSLRKTSVISKGQAVISPEDIQMWFADIHSYLSTHPDLMEALGDPQRIFNQDETACELGVGEQWVLAKKNTKQVYNVSSSTREHVTVSFMVSAVGEVSPPRVIFAGKRDLAKTKLKDLPRNGRTGEWLFSYSENGWVNQEIFVQIIRDLGDYLRAKGIPTLVLLFIDGASCHVSLSMAELCNQLGIQPILLRPNTTHLCQALDVTFYASLKARIKIEKEEWHRQPTNIGNTLNKYSVIALVHKASENILEHKPNVITNGFQKAGIYPWNPNAPNMDCTAPSHVYVKEKAVLPCWIRICHNLVPCIL